MPGTGSRMSVRAELNTIVTQGLEGLVIYRRTLQKIRARRCDVDSFGFKVVFRHGIIMAGALTMTLAGVIYGKRHPLVLPNIFRIRQPSGHDYKLPTEATGNRGFRQCTWS